MNLIMWVIAIFFHDLSAIISFFCPKYLILRRKFLVQAIWSIYFFFILWSELSHSEKSFSTVFLNSYSLDFLYYFRDSISNLRLHDESSYIRFLITKILFEWVIKIFSIIICIYDLFLLSWTLSLSEYLTLNHSLLLDFIVSISILKIDDHFLSVTR